MDSKFKRNFLKGSAAATIGTVSSMVFHFASIMLLTRNMPKAEFGVYALVLVTTALFGIIAGAGLEYTLVRYAAVSIDGKKQGVLFPIVVLRSLSLFIVSMIFIFFGKYLLNIFAPRLIEYILSLTLLSVINSYKELIFNYLQGKNLFKKFAIVQTLAAASRVLMIVIYLFLKKLSIDSLIFIEIVTSIFPLVILLFNVPKSEISDFKRNIQQYRDLIKFSIPLYMNNLLTFSYDKINIFMIAAFLTPVSIASYDVANRIPESLKRIFAAFTIVFFPGMTRLISENNKEGAIKLMNKSLVVFSYVLSTGVLISFFFSSQIIKLLFSDTYIESSIGFSLLMFNFCLRALSNIMGYSLVSAGYSSAPVKANIISSAISIAGGLLLIPAFGFMGAIYGILVMSIVSQFSYTFFLKKAEMPARNLEYLKPLMIIIPIITGFLIFHIHSVILKLLVIFAFIVISAFNIDDIRNIILNKIVRGGIDKKKIKLQKHGINVE